MGKKSQERMTGKTLEERGRKPKAFRHFDYLKEERMRRKERKVIAMLMRAVRKGNAKFRENDAKLEGSDYHG
jgi:hypothetical protein